jgi:hypothetical protein
MQKGSFFAEIFLSGSAARKSIDSWMLMRPQHECCSRRTTLRGELVHVAALIVFEDFTRLVKEGRIEIAPQWAAGREDSINSRRPMAPLWGGNWVLG